MSTTLGFAPPTASPYFANLARAASSLVSALFAPLPVKTSDVIDKSEIYRAARQARAFSPNLANELNAIACRD